MSTQKDGGLVSFVLEHAPKFGLHLWRQNSGARSFKFRGAPAGTADVIGWSPLGRFIGIECKKPNAKSNPGTLKAQLAFHDRANATVLGRSYFAYTRDEALELLALIRLEDEALEPLLPKPRPLFARTQP